MDHKFNLIEVQDLFDFYLEYVKGVIAEYDKTLDVRPMSFDEWYHREYLINIHEYSMSITVDVESAGKKLLCRCVIPEGIFTETGGLLDATLLDAVVERLRDKLPAVNFISVGRYKFTYAVD